MAPIIDAVRVTSEGVIIIVGRGEPGSMVTIIDNGAAIGTVTVDEGGEFFFMGDAPLAPGGHQIDLLAEAPEGGEARPTEEMVLLIVPQRMETITGDPVGRPEEEGALALLVPRDDVGPTRPLQTPAPPVMSEAPSPDAETAVAEPSGEPADGQPSPSEPPPEAETVVTETLGEAAEEVPLPPSPEPPPASPAPTPAEDETAPSPALAIEVIDYDDRGRLIVSGAAPPEAQLLLYLDNILIGNGIAGPNARFEIRPEAGVVPGLYTLRLDQVDDSGRVLARVETPFQRAAPLAQRPEHGQVIVQPGNNLWRIARQTYGAGMQYTVIYQANREQIRDPDLIYPGQIFVLPDPPDSLPLGVPG